MAGGEAECIEHLIGWSRLEGRMVLTGREKGVIGIDHFKVRGEWIS